MTLNLFQMNLSTVLQVLNLKRQITNLQAKSNQDFSKDNKYKSLNLTKKWKSQLNPLLLLLSSLIVKCKDQMREMHPLREKIWLAQKLSKKKNLFTLIRQQQFQMRKRYHSCILSTFPIKMELVRTASQNKIWFTTIRMI